MDESKDIVEVSGAQIKFSGGDNGRPSSAKSLMESGMSPTEVKFTRPSWRMPEERFAEFLRFAQDLSSLKVRPLTKEDVKDVKGECYRGTQLLLTILPLYATNNFYLVRDYSTHDVWKPTEMRSFLTTRGSSQDASVLYANKFINEGGAQVPEIEQKMLDRVMQDNGHDPIEEGEWMVHPVVLGFNKKPHPNPIVDRMAEGVLDGAKPNLSSLQSIANTLGVTLDEFKSRYPILCSTFQD